MDLCNNIPLGFSYVDVMREIHILYNRFIFLKKDKNRIVLMEMCVRVVLIMIMYEMRCVSIYIYIFICM